MNSNFYRAFEDRFRGDMQDIQKRLAIYIPLIDYLKQHIDSNLAIDLGCGRGEWLELLRQQNLNAIGIDLDQGMLQAAREKGFNVKHQDALSYLAQTPDNSLALVSAFHLIEHIGFEQKKSLIQEALRCLKPGGLLILETPNPENMSVGSHSFYLDPTHLTPVPPEFLDFLALNAGFSQTKIWRLQEPNAKTYGDSMMLSDVIYGVSPDFGLIAQKKASKAIENIFLNQLPSNLGMSLNQMVGYYDAHQQTNLKAIEKQLQENSEQIQENSEKIQENSEQVQQLNSELYQLLNSRSWKITRPLRVVRQRIDQLKVHTKFLIQSVKKFFKYYVIRILSKLKFWVLKYPKFKKWAKVILQRFPKISQRLMHLTFQGQVHQDEYVDAHLTIRALTYYTALQKRREIKQTENHSVPQKEDK
jgi:O-antigen chain-terminating methyltransferase